MVERNYMDDFTNLCDCMIVVFVLMFFEEIIKADNSIALGGNVIELGY